MQVGSSDFSLRSHLVTAIQVTVSQKILVFLPLWSQYHLNRKKILFFLNGYQIESVKSTNCPINSFLEGQLQSTHYLWVYPWEMLFAHKTSKLVIIKRGLWKAEVDLECMFAGDGMVITIFMFQRPKLYACYFWPAHSYSKASVLKPFGLGSSLRS